MLSILIVEDQAMIAAGLAQAVEDVGATVLGPVATVAEALVLIATGGVDAVVVDGSLADRDITPVALLLIEKAVPFVVHSGQDLPLELSLASPDILVVMKPAPASQVLEMLLTAMG